MKLFTLIPAMLFLFGCSHDPKKKPASQKDYELGNRLFNDGKPDSAYLAYSRYVTTTNDTLQKGEVYRYMGEMLWENGDLHAAEENLAAGIHTLDTLNEKHHAEISYLYNDLGNVNLDLRRFNHAIAYHDSAIRFCRGNDFAPEPMNGKATVLQKMERYNEAVALYDSIFLLKPTNPKLMARIIDNRARTKWLRDNTYPALPEYWSALKIRTDSDYNAGLNASYAHLSEYYERPNPDSALLYANKMLEKARANNSPADVLEAIDKLVRLYPSAALKKQWYTAFKNLGDSLQLSKDTTRYRFAMIRYDFQKSEADNLVLKDQNRNQRLWMYGLITLAVLTITSISLWYARRRKRIKRESENTIRNAQLKTSKKVHDVVANQLYRIMNELEHSNTIDKEILTNRIEVLYEQSRDISYEDIPVDNVADHNTQVHDILKAFDNEHTKVFIVGNGQAFWSSITTAQKQELQLMLNEIMVNMQKHSQAKNVVVEFKQEDNKGLINYKDDGVGFNVDQKFGNGLNNTVSRIKSLNGAINFGKSEKGGASISISLPLQSSNT